MSFHSAWWGNQWFPNTSASTSVIYPTAFVHSDLPSVLDSPSKPLSDREWLDAQIAEVCDLAVAA